MGDLFAGDVEQGRLGVGRAALADHPAPGDVVVEAHGADEVGVEGEKLPRLYHAVGALLEPGIGARTAGQQPGLGILTAKGQAPADEVAEGFGLLHSRNGELVQGAHGALAGGERRPERP